MLKTNKKQGQEPIVADTRGIKNTFDFISLRERASERTNRELFRKMNFEINDHY